MTTKQSLSGLMQVSWEIQRNKRCSRSKALIASWAILSNEQVLLRYFSKKLTELRRTKQKFSGQPSLFNLSILSNEVL